MLLSILINYQKLTSFARSVYPTRLLLCMIIFGIMEEEFKPEENVLSLILGFGGFCITS